MSNIDKTRNTLAVFLGTFGVFRFYNKVISPRWPQYDRHLYICGRRVHHYEVGLYTVALGLALFLEDMHDIEQDILDGKAKKKHI